MTNLTPKTDEQFVIAAKSIATAFLDRFARMGMSPDEIANLCGAALTEVMAQQLTPFGAVERLRLLADTFEKQLLTDGLPD